MVGNTEIGGWSSNSQLSVCHSLARFCRDNPSVVIGASVIAAWAIIALLAPVAAPYSPNQPDIMHRLEPPSSKHVLGTDDLGRDVLSRIYYGARISLPAGGLLVIISGATGTAVGTIAGYAGGVYDEVLMRVTDLTFAFPNIVLAMALAAALGPGFAHALIAIAVVWWPAYARLARSVVLSVSNEEYVTAARALGLGPIRLLFAHILRNGAGPIIVLATLDFGLAILAFSSLSFLGLGVTPPDPEWGSMVSFGAREMDQWWLGTFPGLAIMTVVLAANIMGDGLRDASDPHSRRT